jgi:hypothetical protein
MSTQWDPDEAYDPHQLEKQKVLNPTSNSWCFTIRRRSKPTNAQQ